MHYVIGDVHGCYTEMIQLIDKINSIDSSAQFIFVGDFVVCVKLSVGIN